MKTKKVTYPTGVWVSFGSQGNIIAAGMMPRRELYYSSKLYHLHPGNEVARALNIIRGEGLLTCPKCGKIDEPAQVCQYCRHQWYTTSRLDRGCEKDIKL